MSFSRHDFKMGGTSGLQTSYEQEDGSHLHLETYALLYQMQKLVAG